MSLKVSLVHSCHDQAKILAFMEPFLFAESATPPLTLSDFIEMWNQAAKILGEERNPDCLCRFRVTVEEANQLVEKGVADYLITEWRFNADKRIFFPAPNPNLVWGGKQAEDLGLVKSSYAQKTPRVMTIEKANIHRAYLDGDKDEAARIEVWGELSREVVENLTSYYEEIFDPFKGCPVISVPFGWDPRTCPGKDVDNGKNS